MKVIVDLCVVPIGVGIDLAPYVAACQQVLQQRASSTNWAPTPPPSKASGGR